MWGTLANAGAIIVGSLIGMMIRSRLPQRTVDLLFQAIGLFTVAIGVEMSLKSDNLLIALLSLVIGGVVGQAMRLDELLRRFSERMQKLGSKRCAVTPAEGSPNRFAEGFVTATMLFCVGSMSVLGAIEEGSGQALGAIEEGSGQAPRLLLTKSIMDGISSIALASSFGISILFSSVPLLIYQGGLTLFAGIMLHLLPAHTIADLTGVGGILLIGLGISILKIKEINVINLLPALVVAVLLSYCW